jgi:hypothetical protein
LRPAAPFRIERRYLKLTRWVFRTGAEPRGLPISAAVVSSGGRGHRPGR